MRLIATIAFTVFLLPAGWVSAQEVKTRYFLSKSVVTLSGMITTKNTFPSDPTQSMVRDGSVDVSQITLTLSSVPDPNAPIILTSSSSLLSKKTVSAELTGSGLLIAVNTKSEGVLGAIVKNLFGAVVTVAKLGSGTLMTPLSDAEKMYGNRQPMEATRRVALKSAIQEATKLLIETEQKAIQAEKPAERKIFRDRIDDLKSALSNLRAELQLAETHYLAWKARQEDSRERRFERVVDVDALPLDADIRALAVKPNVSLDEVAKAAGAFADIVRSARLVVTQSLVPAESSTTNGNTESEAVMYRAVRPITMALYVLDANDKPVLSKQSVEYVTGRRSPLVTLPIVNSKWSNKSLGVTFLNGALTKVTSETGSELAGAAEALRGLPAEYVASLKQANEIATEQNKLALAGVQGQIDELKKQKELIEARITSGESGDLAAMQAETARLDAEVKLLTSHRALAAANQSSQENGASLGLQVQMLKLQNELADAQLKQLQLQQQIDEARAKAGK